MADYARVAWHGENPFESVRERERELVEVWLLPFKMLCARV